VVGGRIWQRWYAAKFDGILLLPRSHTNTNSNRNGSGFSYTCNFTYGHIYAPNADGNCDSNSHSDSNTNGYRNSDANGWPAGYAHSKASPHSGTAPVAFIRFAQAETSR